MAFPSLPDKCAQRPSELKMRSGDIYFLIPLFCERTVALADVVDSATRVSTSASSLQKRLLAVIRSRRLKRTSNSMPSIFLRSARWGAPKNAVIFVGTTPDNSH